LFWEKINKRWRRKVMRRNLYGAIAGIIPALLLSVAMLISAFHYNVAQAKSRSAVAVACGKELKKQCSGVAVAANNMLECLQKSQVSRRCAGLAHNVVRMCDRGASAALPRRRRGSGQHSWMSDNRQGFSFIPMQRCYRCGFPALAKD
jgi:hypothetical protein